MPDQTKPQITSEMTTEQAAEILGCSPRTIRNMILRGTLTARLDKADPTVEKGRYLIPSTQVYAILKDKYPR